jgi:UDP-glucose 4-epimerase
MRILVTGGAGFIGSHVCERFLHSGNEVVALDDLSTGLRKNLPAGSQLEVIDIVNAAAVEELVGGFRPELVYHLAAQASITISVREPERDLDVNVRGTLNVLAVVPEGRGAGRLLVDRWGAVWRRGTNPDRRGRRLASAARTLRRVEARRRGVHGYLGTALRHPHRRSPPGQRLRAAADPHGEAGVVAIFSDRLLRGERPVVYGDGLQTRDYIYTSDVAAAFEIAGERGEGT